MDELVESAFRPLSPEDSDTSPVTRQLLSPVDVAHSAILINQWGKLSEILSCTQLQEELTCHQCCSIAESALMS